MTLLICRIAACKTLFPILQSVFIFFFRLPLRFLKKKMALSFGGKLKFIQSLFFCFHLRCMRKGWNLCKFKFRVRILLLFSEKRNYNNVFSCSFWKVSIEFLLIFKVARVAPEAITAENIDFELSLIFKKKWIILKFFFSLYFFNVLIIQI